jgi:hypothetical protein
MLTFCPHVNQTVLRILTLNSQYLLAVSNFIFHNNVFYCNRWWWWWILFARWLKQHYDASTLDSNNDSYFNKYKNVKLLYRRMYWSQNFVCNNDTIIVRVKSKIDEFNIRKLIRLKWTTMLRSKQYNIRLLFVVECDVKLHICDDSQSSGDILSTSIT